MPRRRRTIMFLEPKLMKTECGGDLLAWGNARFVVRASRKHPNTYTASCRMRSSCTLAENGGKCCQGKFVKNVGGDLARLSFHKTLYICSSQNGPATINDHK